MSRFGQSSSFSRFKERDPIRARKRTYGEIKLHSEDAVRNCDGTARDGHRCWLGLLRPADVDGRTGYRRYAIRQADRGHRIRMLRSVEMSPEDMAIVLDGDDDTARSVMARRLRFPLAITSTRATNKTRARARRTTLA